MCQLCFSFWQRQNISDRFFQLCLPFYSCLNIPDIFLSQKWKVPISTLPLQLWHSAVLTIFFSKPTTTKQYLYSFKQTTNQKENWCWHLYHTLCWHLYCNLYQKSISKGEWLSFEVVINHSVRLKGSKKYHQHPHHSHNFVLIRIIVVVKVIKQY